MQTLESNYRPLARIAFARLQRSSKMSGTLKLTDAVEGDSCPPYCSLLRAWKIEPAGNHGIDALYILDDGRWSGVMGQVEYALEQQMESDDGGGKMERPWNEILVTITGVLLTPEQWEEICDDDS